MINAFRYLLIVNCFYYVTSFHNLAAESSFVKDEVMASGVEGDLSSDLSQPKASVDAVLSVETIDDVTYDLSKPIEVGSSDEGGFISVEGEFVEGVDLEDMDDIEKIQHYRLRVGDVLLLALYGEPDTYESVSVDPGGNISYLFAHDVKAYGRTVAELRDELKSVLEKYYKYPIILITPQQFVPHYYTILGEVNFPGAKEIQGNSTLIKAFAEAGGFATRIYRDQTMYTVDFDRCFLARKGECLLKIDFEELVNGDFSQNVKLEPQDFIYVASNDKQRVFILGEVARPGTYDFFGSMSLVEAIALAGGLRADASSRVSVVRGAIGHPTQYYIDANLIMRGRARDFSLKPSDIVYIPPRKFTNLRLFLQAAVRGFVGNAASQAGNSAFIQTTPDAAGERATGSTLDFNPAGSPTVIVP